MAVYRGCRKIKILGNREFVFTDLHGRYICVWLYKGKGGTPAIILHLDARLRWVVGLKSQQLYTRFPLEGLDGFQSQPEHFGSREKSRAPTRNKSKFFFIARPTASILYRLRNNGCLQGGGKNSVTFHYRIIAVCFILQSTKRREWKQVSKSNKTQTWCNTVQVLFLQTHSTCFGRQAPIIRSIKNWHGGHWCVCYGCR